MEWRDVVPYGLFKDDYRGFRHSIDKCIIIYPFTKPVLFDSFCDCFSELTGFLFQPDKSVDGWNCYFDKPACSSYSWYASSFWFPHCNVKYGAYYRNMNVSTKKPVWEKRQYLRIEFNPNKVFSDPCFCSLMSCVSEFCKTGILEEVDYSVDLPASTSHVITQSLKDKVIYNDSRYYGKRHKNGRIKVYNKGKELLDKDKIHLENPLTRCEITCKYQMPLDFNSVSFCSSSLTVDNNLSSNLRSICDLIILASSYGEDREELLRRFVPDKRNRVKLQPFLFGDSESVFDLVFFALLLMDYAKLYNFHFYFTGPPVIASSHNVVDLVGGWYLCSRS